MKKKRRHHFWNSEKVASLTVSNKKVANKTDLSENNYLDSFKWKSSEFDSFDWKSDKLDSFEWKCGKIDSFEKLKK